MKNYRARHSTEPFPFPATGDDGPETDAVFRDQSGVGLPEGWRERSSGRPGARLYCFTPPDGGEVQWQAEITLGRRVLRRRYATELRARAWLAVWDKHRFPLGFLHSEEPNGRFRLKFNRPA